MADVHERLVTVIICVYQIVVLFRSFHPIKRTALLLILHNVLLYYIINCFKHLAQESPGPVNTFFYLPLVYEEPAPTKFSLQWHAVLRTPTWQFFESLFRHHLALLVPFNLALFVPRCKLLLISSLVIASNFGLFVCFMASILHWLLLSGFGLSYQLLPILCFGPLVQLALMCRLLARIWVGAWSEA